VVVSLAATVQYSGGQALADLYQVGAIAVLVVALLAAIVLDLVVAPSWRGAVSAAIALLGFAGSGGWAAGVWLSGGGAEPSSAYSGFATGDRFALFFELFFAVLGIITVLSARGYLRRRQLLENEFNVLLLAATAGMSVMASATSLVTVFLGLELLSISLYILSAYARADTSSQEAGAKYLLVGGFASAFVLYGMALTYGATGSTVIPDIARAAGGATSSLLLMGILLMGVGFGFKVSAAPFHMWTPDVYQGAPMPVTAFMSVGTKAAAFAMIVRVFASGLPHLAPQWQALLAFVAAASMVVGNLMAIVQQSVKRLLAYSGIAQAGYVLIGVIAGGRLGVGAVLFYLVAYLLMNFGAFAVLVALSGAGGDIDRMTELNGLGERNPFLAFWMTVFMLSLAGFPPTAGFIGKLFLFEAGVAAGYTWLVILAVLMSVVSVYYYFGVVRRVWSRGEALPQRAAPAAARVGVGALALAAFALGIAPSFVLLLGQSGALPVLAGGR
jgi:NADH-quinone oxidoreductase subunit N